MRLFNKTIFLVISNSNSDGNRFFSFSYILNNLLRFDCINKFTAVIWNRDTDELFKNNIFIMVKGHVQNKTVSSETHLKF